MVDAQKRHRKTHKGTQSSNATQSRTHTSSHTNTMVVPQGSRAFCQAQNASLFGLRPGEGGRGLLFFPSPMSSLPFDFESGCYDKGATLFLGTLTDSQTHTLIFTIVSWVVLGRSMGPGLAGPWGLARQKMPWIAQTGDGEDDEKTTQGARPGRRQYLGIVQIAERGR